MHVCLRRLGSLFILVSESTTPSNEPTYRAFAGFVGWWVSEWFTPNLTVWRELRARRTNKRPSFHHPTGLSACGYGRKLGHVAKYRCMTGSHEHVAPTSLSAVGRIEYTTTFQIRWIVMNVTIQIISVNVLLGYAFHASLCPLQQIT